MIIWALDRSKEASTNFVRTNRAEPSSTCLFISLTTNQADLPFHIQGNLTLDTAQDINKGSSDLDNYIGASMRELISPGGIEL